MATRKQTTKKSHQIKELSVAEQKIASFALQHGITHAELTYGMSRTELEKLVAQHTAAVKKQ